MNSHQRARRDVVAGWSHSSTRSNTRFLYSVDERHLTGWGFALTLTVRECPPSHDHWHRLRRAYIERLRRMGLVRLHWLTEWQRRGVPHLHAAIWLQPDSDGFWRHAGEVISDPVDVRFAISRHWCELAEPYGAGLRGQNVQVLSDSVGWFQYLSKHASRGLSHYQRSAEGIPEGWQRTGRMWGHVGDWPLQERVRIEMDNPGFWALRRICRGWRHADARAEGSPGRIASARRMLTCHDRPLSSVRGVSEWIPTKVQELALWHLAGRGFAVRS